MTLQELLKNDEDKRSDLGGKSGERLGVRRRRRLSVAAVTCSSRRRCHRSITVSVYEQTGQWHQTQKSLFQRVPAQIRHWHSGSSAKGMWFSIGAFIYCQEFHLTPFLRIPPDAATWNLTGRSTCWSSEGQKRQYQSSYEITSKQILSCHLDWDHSGNVKSCTDR